MQIKNRYNYPGKGVRIDRSSPLGNPYRIGRDGTRAEVIEKYRHWIWGQMSKPGTIGNHRIMQALAELDEDSILICWCAPKPCHGSIVIKAWKWAKEKGLI